MKTHSICTLFFAGIVALGFSGCDKKSGASGAESGTKTTVKIDGSSTVFPISEAVAEEYQSKHGGRVTIGVSGTGGGFKKFCAGEIAITGASRSIKDTEAKLCTDGGVDYIELPVAYDGISVVINPKNTWVDHLTTAELKTIWEPGAQKKITSWKQVRSTFPDKPLTLFGPGVDSGTFDYFTKKICGKSQASRGDYTASEDDNVLVHGVVSDESALGFFGYAYYLENKGKLKAVPIKAGDGAAISPTMETIADGSYKPLSRPIFIYVNKAAAKAAEIDKFVKFYLAESGTLSKEVGYIPLPADVLAEATARYTKGVGSTAK